MMVRAGTRGKGKSESDMMDFVHWTCIPNATPVSVIGTVNWYPPSGLLNELAPFFMHLTYKRRRRLALYFTLDLDRTSNARDFITQAFYSRLGS